MRVTKTVPLSTFVGVIVGIAAFIALQSWVLGVVLGWFGITLAFWKCLVIVLLIGSLFSSSRSN